MAVVTFPPAAPEHIDAYDPADVFAGYAEWRADDPAPGPNRSEGYRWGWLNCARDHSGKDDGHDTVRHAYLRSLRP